MPLRNLQPSHLWNHFADLNAIPRASKHEEKVTAFVRAFGEKLGLETMQDETGNVIIRKPATQGLEDRPSVLLQSHVDMVHQKNADVNFDFARQGIEMYVDGDFVRAKGTTLGADNGIGVSAIMAILESKDIPHPALEALFTVDEETGMTGALGLKGGLLKATIMLNLDTEDDHELTIGCAGGVDVTGTGDYPQEAAGEGLRGFQLTVTGLKGGHSGMDIHLGRGNANKLMNRLLYTAAEQFGLRIASVDGGSLRNAIPRESKAIVVVPIVRSLSGVEAPGRLNGNGETQARPLSAGAERSRSGVEGSGPDNAEDFRRFIESEAATLRAEYAVTDPELKITLTEAPLPPQVAAQDFQDKLLAALYACPSGIHRMSPEVAGLVQTSNNLSRVLLQEGRYSVQCLTRSAVDSEKNDLARAIKATLQLAGASVEFAGDYPGWAPKPGSGIARLMTELYRERFHSEPLVDACHAGLECGIIGANYPGMEMISFGPNITGAHSPDEAVQISSVEKFWGYLLEVLARV